MLLNCSARVPSANVPTPPALPSSASVEVWFGRQCPLAVWLSLGSQCMFSGQIAPVLVHGTRQMCLTHSSPRPHSASSWHSEAHSPSTQVCHSGQASSEPHVRASSPASRH